MDRWVGRVALVTGASCGIGAAICRELVKAGMIVVGAARNVERIEALSEDLKGNPGTLFAVKCDLTKDGDVENLFSVIKEKYKGVDICINNAGMSYSNSLLDGNTKEWREVIDLNVVALCLCTKLAVKSMQERGVDDGHIIHVSSICGHYVLPVNCLHFYIATKFAVTALTEGLRQELRDLNSKIRVSAISPGLVETEFVTRQRGEEEGRKAYAAEPCLQSEDVAASVCHIISAPPHVQVHDLIVRPTCS
ncbi:dehydrogenase/reductase SDR family member 11-like [Macrobrachium rosenbergii]|uniref:dehydrogenase/reductase SDR family member 11-like n=1 Tax=Macrobrachium rosenbergii TaxID=79674 RepID=UPI0034D6FB23